MKLIYSHLQKFLPSLDVKPQQLRDDLTMIGHFTNFYEEIEGEIVFDLDIKANRGDGLGYYGLARDLSVFYNIELKLPMFPELRFTDYVLPITVTSPDITRVMCLKISNVKVGPSPEWLAKFCQIHGVNSYNNIVDLTNYVMFFYGLPNHAFDATICSNNLIWENNHGKNKEFTTLDGTVLKLSDENLVISNPEEVLSTDLVGGIHSGINNSTTDIIIEVAVYNRVRIRLDSKFLKTVTEASTRLEKDLDPDTIPIAFNNLAALITQNCEGQISSSVFDYYPQKQIPPQIEFDLNKPSLVSGINIPTDFVTDCLTRLGCSISPPFIKGGNKEVDFVVTPPSIRKDLNLEEDLVEEVVRFWGYQKIPIDQPLSYKKLPDITPPILYLIEKIKDDLVALGYDEIRSWPLVQSPLDQSTAVFTQNSINSDYPVLRQSMIQSLKLQNEQYFKYKLDHQKFFEIGKIFWQEGSKYQERYALGVYNYNSEELQKDLSTYTKVTDNYVQIILDGLPKSSSYIPKDTTNNAYELTSQIITLDANITLEKEEPLESLFQKYQKIVGNQYLWEMAITDHFEDAKTHQHRYTFRVSYFNCDDKTAKQLHLKSFNLDSFTSPVRET